MESGAGVNKEEPVVYVGHPEMVFSVTLISMDTRPIMMTMVMCRSSHLNATNQ